MSLNLDNVHRVVQEHQARQREGLETLVEVGAYVLTNMLWDNWQRERRARGMGAAHYGAPPAAPPFTPPPVVGPAMRYRPPPPRSAASPTAAMPHDEAHPMGKVIGRLDDPAQSHRAGHRHLVHHSRDFGAVVNAGG